MYVCLIIRNSQHGSLLRDKLFAGVVTQATMLHHKLQENVAHITWPLGYLYGKQTLSVSNAVYSRALQSHTLLINQEWFAVINQLLEALNLLHSSCLIQQDIN